ncbi:MAG: hypothetical protein M3367_06585 [Acidobacteriota bacterium]|nr:hypothetical protein [Acidobacteriota bacterium]
MNTQRIGMPSAASDREGIQSKLNLTLDGKFNGFDVFNHTENSEKIQCDKCKPKNSKPSGVIKLCANCEAERKETATVFFDNFRRHCRVIKLDRFCFSCDTPKSSAMMSKVLPICRGCAGELKIKGATARNNFIARTLNNFHRKLKGAIV